MGKSLKGKELGVGISQRKDGLYQARYTDRFGKRKTIYNSDLRELRKELTVLVSDNIKNSSIRGDMELDQWFKRWMEAYKNNRVSENTKREYTHIYNKTISPMFGKYKLSEIKKTDIQRLILQQEELGYGYERQNKIRIIFSDMFARAVEDDMVVKNPCAGVVVYKEKTFNAKALTLDEQRLFFEHSKDSIYDNLFHVAINTGLRPGELAALTSDDIDFSKNVIIVNKTLVYQKYLDDDCKTFHVGPPKTKQSNRFVPINSACKEYLIKQMELKEKLSKERPREQNDFLFVTSVNTPLNSVMMCAAIESVVKKINKECSLDAPFEYFKFHTFRHTFATRCLESGVAPKTIQKYLGHATIQMTMNLYVHVTNDTAQSEIEKIANIV